MNRLRYFISSIICCCLLLPITAAFAQTNLVQNGTFGTAGAPSAANWICSPGTTEVNPVSSYGGSGNNPVLEVDEQSCATQDICVLPGLSYTFSFVASRRTNGGTPATITTLVSIAGLDQSNAVVATYNNTSFSRSNTTFSLTAQTYTFTPGSTVRKIRVTFSDNTPGTATLGMIIDDVTLTATDPVASNTPTPCVNANTAFSVAGTGTGTVTYNWAFGTDATPQTSASATPSVSWSASGTKPVQVVLNNGTCDVYTLNTSALVNPLPTITTGTVNAVCQGTTSFTIPYTATSGSPNQYSLSSSNLTGFTAVNNAALPASPISVTIPGAAAAGTYNFILTVRNSTTGCVSANVPFTLTIHPTPTVTAPANGNYCHGAAVAAVALTGAPAGVTYDISGGAGIGLANQTGVSQIPAFTASNTGTTPVTATISVTPKANGCTGSTQTFTITVSPVPTISNAGPDQNLCNVTSATLSGNTPTAGTGAWIKVSGPAATITNAASASATVTGLTAGTYVFRWTISSGSCTASTDEVTVVVSATPTTAAAGADQNLCNVTSATLSGNTPLAGTGAWTKVSGPAATITNPANASTTITGLTTGTYVFRYTISNGTCTASTDDITIVNSPAPTTAAAGADQNLCNVTSATLAGNTPAAGTGAWTKVSGPAATITDPSSASTTVTGLTAGTYVFRWTISSGSCTASTDDVTIVNSATPTTAAAGADQDLCNVTSANLAGNIPTAGTGAWTKVSGPAATITNLSSASTTITGLTPGTYVFRWTISNGACTASTDDVTIVNSATPTTALAGADQDLCNVTSATLGANTPVSGTGAWTKVSGPAATITDPANASTTITGLTPGTYVFRWTITNGNCTNSTDDVQLTIAPIPTTADAGADQTLCNVTSATMAANTPVAGTGQWYFLSGPNTPVFTTPASPATTVTGLVPGTYEFIWAISSVPCAASTDNVKVVVNALPSAANAGTDQTQYNSGVFVMNANTPAIGTGTWSLVSGSANITNPNAPNTNITISPNTTATLRWTIANGNCTAATDDVTLTYTRSADLKITKSDAGSIYETGKKVVYTITVENLGPSNAQDFQIQDLAPAELENYTWNAVTTGSGVTIIPSSGTGNNINCSGTMPFAPGNKIVITVEGFIRASVTGGVVITNNANVVAAADVPDPVAGNNSSAVTGTVANNLPVANADQFTTVRDVAVSENVLTNDTDPENDPLTVNTTPVTPPANGTLTLNADGTFTYTPEPGFTGTDGFVYTVCDNKGGCAQGTVTISITAAVTDLSVTKVASVTQAVAGSPITYTITVTNAGPSTILSTETFQVSDPLPSGFTTETVTASEGTYNTTNGNWTGVQFTPGKTITLTIAGHINAAFTGNSIDNTVNVNPPPGFSDPSPATATVTTPVSRNIDLQISKTDGKAVYTPGTNAIYTISITNTGPSDVVGAQVNDPLPAGIAAASWNVNVSGGASTPAGNGTGAINQLVNIPLGGTVVYTFNVTIPSGFTGNLVNTATVTAPAGYTDSNPANNTATDTNTPDLQYDVSITKTAPSSAVPGGPIHYEIVMQNAGPSDLVNATITDAIPAVIQNPVWTVSAQGAASASVAGGNGNNISFTGSLPAGNANILVVAIDGTIAASATGVVENTASITPPGKPAINSNPAISTLQKQTGLTLSKSGPATGSSAAGAPIEYIIQVTNAGPSDATSVVITDVVPASVTNVSWTATPHGNASVVTGSGTGNNISITGNIAAGSGNNIEIRINGTVQSSFSGVLRNEATATPPAGTPATDSEVTTIENTPGLVITKSGPAQADAGGTISYTVTVNNSGPSDAVNAAITDIIHADIQNVQWTATASGAASIVSGASGTGNNVNLTANIPAGTGNTITVQITGNVKPGASGNAVNTASVQVPGQPAIASNEITTAIINRPGISIIKSAPDTVTAGGTINYTITVQNAGPSDAFDVLIRDTLPAQLLNAVVNTTENGNAAIGTSNVNNGIVEIRASIPAGSGNGVLAVVTAKVDPAFKGDIFNRAVVKLANGTDIPSAQVKTVVKDDPLIKITKSAPAQVPAGGNIVYTLTVSNAGLSDAPVVDIEDLVPAAVMNVTWTTQVSGTASVTSGATGSGNAVAVKAALPADPSAKIVITITGKADPAATADLVNFAKATPQDKPAVPSDTTNTQVTSEPELHISKAAPAIVSSGNAIVYTITVGNSGLSDARNVSITDAVPAEIRNVSWTATASNGAVLLSGATGTGNAVNVSADIPTGTAAINITINGTTDPAFSGMLSNTATATVNGKPAVSSNANTNARNVAAVRITKTGPATNVAGTQIAYNLIITNDGPSDAKDILISDLIPAAVLNPSWIATAFGAANIVSGNTGSGYNLEVRGNIPAGSGNRIMVAIGGTADPAFEGLVSNSASAAAADQPIVYSDTVNTDIVNKPNLLVLKTGSATLPAGSRISYIIAVTNTGPASDAKNITISDIIPAAVKNATWTAVTSGNTQILSGSGGNGNNVTVTANIPSSPASDLTIYIDGDVDPNFTGTLVNYATVEVPGKPTQTSDTVKTIVTNEVAVKMVKSAASSLAAGEQITYTLNVTNDGPSNANNLQIRDTVPASISNVTWTATVNGAAQVTSSASGTGNIIAVTGNIPAGAVHAVLVTVTGVIQPAFTGSTIENRAHALPDGKPVVSDTAITAVENKPGIHIVKSGPAALKAGQSLSYNIQITNTGPSDAVGLIIRDTLNAAILNPVWTVTTSGAGTSVSSNAGSGNIDITGNIPAGSGQKIDITVTGTLNPAFSGTSISNTAHAIPAGLPGVSSTAVTTTSRSSDLLISKSGPLSAVAGEDITYTLVVTNNGPSDANGIIIRDTVPASITNVTWSAVANGNAVVSIPNGTGNVINLTGDVAADGSTITIIINGKVNPAAPNGVITNTARALPPVGITDFAEVSSTVATTVSRQADLVIVKSGPANKTTGEMIAYKLVITNMGLSDVTDALIIDSLPGGILNPVVTASQTGGASFAMQPTVDNVVKITGSIPAGSGNSITVNITGLVDPGAPAAAIRNVAKVLPPSDVIETIPETNTSIIQTNLTKDVGVLISKSGPASVNIKDQITYTIEITNTGISNADPIKILDTIPPEITGVTWSAVVEGGESTGVTPASGSGNLVEMTGKVQGFVPGIPARILITVVGTVSTSAGLTITNTASAEFEGKRESTVITSVNKSVDLLINKTAPAVIAAGQKITYTLKLTNNGPADAMSASIADNVPATVQNVSWKAEVSGGAAVSAASGTGNNIALTGDIPATTGVITITIEGTIDPGYTGQLINTAQAEPAAGVADPRPTMASVTTNVIKQSGLSIVKSGPGSIQAGLPVTYTLNIYNAGPSNANAVNITDLVPAQIANVKWSSSVSGGASVTANATGTGNQVELTAEIPAKAAVSVTIEGISDPAFNGMISNVATAGNDDQTVMSDSLKTNVIYAPSLAISKSGTDKIDAGQPVNYIITLSNNGPSVAQNVNVTDIMPAALTNVRWFARANGTAAINGGNLADQTGNVGFTATIPPGTANNIVVTVNSLVNPDATGIMKNIVRAGLPEVADSITTVISNTPALRLIKSAPTELGAGNDLNYNIDIFNDGPSTAKLVTVNDVLPAQMLNAVWSATANGAANIVGGNLAGQTGNVTFVANIPAGTTNSIRVNIAGKADPAFTGTVQNTAKATPQGGTEVSSNTTSTAVLNNTGLNIIKTGPVKASAGTIVSYHIELSNNGPSDAQNIQVTDVLPVQLQNAVWSATASGSAAIAGGNITDRTGNVNLTTNIPAGGGNFVTVSVTGTLDPAFNGTVSNIASYTKPGESSVNSTSVVTNVTAEAGIQLSKSGPDSLAAGNRIRYVVLVQNAGPSNSGNIIITDTVPVPVRAISWTATATGAATIQGSAAGNGNLISLPVNIPAGSGNSIMLTIEGSIPASFTGVISNRALAASGNDVLALDSISTTVYSSTSLHVTKSGPDVIAAGLPINYTVEITNGGPSNATVTTIKDVVPAQIRNVQWNTTLLGNAQLRSGSAENGTSNDIRLQALIPAGTGNIVRINVNGIVDPGFQGTILNTAIAENINGDADTSAISTLVQAEDKLQVIKTGPTILAAGNTIHYLITASNAGPSDLNGIDITDLVPAAITGVTWSATATGNAVITSGVTGTGNNVLVKGNVPGGAGNAIQIIVDGILNADATGTVSNTAVVKRPDGTTVSSDPEVTQVEQVADLRIQKVAPDKADAGTVMEYTITLQNNGPSNIKNMTVRDTVPAQVQNVTWKATTTGNASAAVLSGTGNLIVFNADLAAGAANQVRLQITGTILPTFAGTITNMAVAEAGKRITSNTAQTIVGRNADLSITKTGKDNVINTDSMSYTITASNAGSAVADGAVITDELPAAMENINARVTGTTGNAGNVALTVTNKQLRAVVGTFPAGGTVRIVVSGTVNGTGRMSNTAAIEPPSGVQDQHTANNVTPPVVTEITPQTKLRATKEILTPAPYSVGSLIRYRLTVNNPGLPALNPVIFTDQLPSPSKVTVPAITAPAKGTAVYDANSNQIRWTIGLMEGNSSTQLEYEMTLIDTGAISNKAVVAVPGTGTFVPALPDSGTVNIASEYLANLKVVKELNTAAPYKIRDVITFTITLSNAGPNKATRIIVEDPIAANLDIPRDIVASAGATTYDAGTRRFVWTLDSLAANATATLRFSIRINSGGSVTNTASGTSAEKDLVPGDNISAIPDQPITGDVVFIPNTFTPNGDGRNDKLVILDVTRFPGSALIIYNRWGNVVYQSKDYQNNWDGSGLNEGTYFYTLELRTPQGIRVFKGWIELLR